MQGSRSAENAATLAGTGEGFPWDSRVSGSVVLSSRLCKGGELMGRRRGARGAPCSASRGRLHGRAIRFFSRVNVHHNPFKGFDCFKCKKLLTIVFRITAAKSLWRCALEIYRKSNRGVTEFHVRRCSAAVRFWTRVFSRVKRGGSYQPRVGLAGSVGS